MSKDIVNSYFAMLKHLNASAKRNLIALLHQSVQEASNPKRSIFYYKGAWDSEETAEEIIQEIRQSSTSHRKLEDF